MKCADCKYWREYGEKPKNIELGKCDKVKMFWDRTIWSEDGEDRIMVDPTEKAFVQDGSDYMAYLLTAHDFGCVQFEPIP